MRWYRGPRGDRRLWFDEDEIEDIVDDELRNAGLLPSRTNPVCDLEGFIEHYLSVELDQYASLEPTVLGLTEFRSDGGVRISINADLTTAALDDQTAGPGLIGRWRATLAHEGAHVLLHRVLFHIDSRQGDLFEGERTATGSALMRCLKRDVGYGVAVSDWREVQANRGMAALLMPRAITRHVASDAMAALGITAPEEGSGDASVLAREVADRLSVSRQAAKIRLATLGIVLPSGAAACRID